MRVSVDRKSFVRELEWVARFIERKTTIPILTNVLLWNRDGSLHMTGTDLEFAGRTSIDSAGPDFTLTVPVHMLLKYLKKVEEDTLTLAPTLRFLQPVQGPHVRDCSGPGHKDCCAREPNPEGALAIEHGGARVEVVGMSADSFPELPAAPPAMMEIGGLDVAIPRIVTSISAEESRFTLNGALLHLPDRENATLVATDGHRLSLCGVKVLAGEAWTGMRALVPRKALLELHRLSDRCLLSVDENHVYFSHGNRTITSRKLSGSFPDYERAMPREQKYTVSVPAAAAKKMLDRVAIFADERSHCCRFTVNDSLEISSSLSDIGGASGCVPIEGPQFAYPYVAAFNADYVTDFLKAANAERVDFLFTKGATAAEFRLPGWRYVIMPMRADEDAKAIPVVEGATEPVPFVIEAMGRQAAAAHVEPSAEPAPVIETPAGDMVDAYEAARILGIALGTLYVKVKAGRVPQPDKTGPKMLWPRNVLVQAVA